MALLLARVDDRLIHGQVVHGWVERLKPTLILVVSDALRDDSASAEVYLLALPEGVRGRIVSVAEALDPSVRGAVEAEGTLLLLGGTEDALRLVAGGFPVDSLNLGGMHHKTGKTEVLPYLFLDDDDRSRLLDIARRGIRVTAQDLPSNPSHPLDSIIGRVA